MSVIGAGIEGAYAEAVVAVESLRCACPNISLVAFNDAVDLVVRESLVVGQSEEVRHFVLCLGSEGASQQQH